MGVGAAFRVIHPLDQGDLHAGIDGVPGWRRIRSTRLPTPVALTRDLNLVDLRRALGQVTPSRPAASHPLGECAAIGSDPA
jgi:hypothetical protein